MDSGCITAGRDEGESEIDREKGERERERDMGREGGSERAFASRIWFQFSNGWQEQQKH